MAVFLDTPVRQRERGRDEWRAHLVSDQAGDAGSRELVVVARTLGLPRAALRHADTPFEHIDLVGEAVIDRARRLSPAQEVTAADILDICRRKFIDRMGEVLERIA